MFGYDKAKKNFNDYFAEKDDMKTNKYYYDLTADELEQFAVEDGVLKFFERVLLEK